MNTGDCLTEPKLPYGTKFVFQYIVLGIFIGLIKNELTVFIGLIKLTIFIGLIKYELRVFGGRMNRFWNKSGFNSTDVSRYFFFRDLHD